MADEPVVTQTPSSTEPVVTSGTPAPTLITQQAPTETPTTPPADGTTPPTDKPAEVAPVVPLTAADLKLPPELAVTEEQSTELLNIFNDPELSPADRASKLMELHATTLRNFAEQTVAEIREQQTKWEDEIKTDKDIGGDKLAPNLIKVSKFLDAMGTPELREALDATGAGSHPAIVRFFIKMAAEHAEGSPAGGSPPPVTTTAAQKMYPSMNP